MKKQHFIYFSFISILFSNFLLASAAFQIPDLSLIGKGSFGIIKKTIDPNVVKKIVTFDLRELETSNNIREIAALQRLNHKNIIKPIKVQFAASNKIEIYLPLGIPITQFVLGSKPIPTPAKYLLKDLSEGLAYLHETENIAHKDLSLNNILFFPSNEGGDYKIIDFGAMRMFPEILPIDLRDESTIYIRPPEQLIARIDGKNTDIWSLGIIFAWSALGLRPSMQNSVETYLIRLMDRFGTPEVGDGDDYHEWIETKAMDSIAPWSISKNPLESLIPLIATKPELKDLLEKIFEYDRRKRISATQILEHPYLFAESSVKEETAAILEDLMLRPTCVLLPPTGVSTDVSTAASASTAILFSTASAGNELKFMGCETDKSAVKIPTELRADVQRGTNFIYDYLERYHKKSQPAMFFDAAAIFKKLIMTGILTPSLPTSLQSMISTYSTISWIIAALLWDEIEFLPQQKLRDNSNFPYSFQDSIKWALERLNFNIILDTSFRESYKFYLTINDDRVKELFTTLLTIIEIDSYFYDMPLTIKSEFAKWLLKSKESELLAIGDNRSKMSLKIKEFHEEYITSQSLMD